MERGDKSYIWLRPATEMEIVMDCANRRGLFNTVYGLTIRSSVPLQDSHIKETLLHMVRKIPSLRTCFRKSAEDNILWACDMNHDNIDFQVTETHDVVTAIEALLKWYYPTTEGPLWCARVLPTAAPHRCSRPELAADFPYVRTLLLANHHGIADGTTNVFIADVFLRLLDDVIANRPIDDSVQLGRLAAGEETKALLNAKMEELRKDKDSYEQLLKENQEKKRQRKFIPEAFPMARDPDFRNQVVLRDLTKEETRSFIQRCKREGVTVNSGLVAVLNVSVVDLVREAGVVEDTYHISEMHAVNLRRYWSGDTSGTLGLHMMATDKVNTTPADWRKDFWEYTRGVHKNMSQGLQDKDALMYVIGMMDEEGAEEHFAERPPPECEYGFANMGNLDPLIPTEGTMTRLTNLIRITSCYNDPMYFMCQTLRGCMMFSLISSSDILTRENANKLVDKIFENLAHVTTI